MTILGEHSHCKHLIHPCADFFGLKNKELEVVAISKRFFSKVGLKPSEDVLGFTDYDIKRPAQLQADRFRAQDRRALSSTTPIMHLEVLQYCDDIDVIVSVKKGVNGQYIAVNNFYLPINKYALLKIDQIRQAIQLKAYPQGKSYEILNAFPGLTTRESVVLFYFIRGHSANKIGILLSRSKRTIEDHIKNIKQKFECTSASDVIEYALCFSYDTYVPLSFMISP